MNDELCRLTGIESRLTSAYHPQTNGLDERFNQTLQRQLLKFVGKEQNEWDLYIDSILFSYRVSRQDSTKYSPYFLVYGRQARLPVQFKTNINEDELKEGYDEMKTKKDLDTQTKMMIKIRRKALENIGIAQCRQKKYFDAKHSKDKGKYRIGALVLLKNSKKLSRKGSKLEPNWTGPYCIHEAVGKSTYRLCSCTSPKKVFSSIYNISRLKLYHENEKSKVHSYNSSNIALRNIFLDLSQKKSSGVKTE